MVLEFTEEQKAYVVGDRRPVNIKIGAHSVGKTFIDLYYSIPKGIGTIEDGEIGVIFGESIDSINDEILNPMRRIWGSVAVGGVTESVTVKDGFHLESSGANVRMFGKDVWLVSTKEGIPKGMYEALESPIRYAYGDNIDYISEDMLFIVDRVLNSGGMFEGTSKISPAYDFIDKYGENVYYWFSHCTHDYSPECDC